MVSLAKRGGPSLPGLATTLMAVLLARRAAAWIQPTTTTVAGSSLHKKSVSLRPPTLGVSLSLQINSSMGDTYDNEDESVGNRRDFMSTVAGGFASPLLLAVATFGVAEPARAVSGMSKVNARLQGFGLPTYQKVPDGFTPLCEIYGKGRNRFPVLVTFAHPLTWIATLPSNDANGEDGTVQAGDYAKGDTATFFVNEEAGHVDDPHDLASSRKDVLERTLVKAISQKGDNMYQNFKVLKVEPVVLDGGEKYVNVDFKYQLLTGAGFEVDRRAVASLTSQGPAVEALWAASTTQRFKKTENDLRNIVASFRCYASGINLSDELVAND